MKYLDQLTDFLTGRNQYQSAIRLFRLALYSFLLGNTLALLPIAAEVWGAEGFMLTQPNWGSPIFALINLLARPGFENAYPFFIAGQLIALGLGFWGRFPKISAIGIWFFSVSLINRGTELSNGGYHMLSLFLFFQMFISEKPAKEGNLWGGISNLMSNLGIWAIRLQVAFLYATAGFYKLGGEHWITGDALQYVLNIPFFSHPVAQSWILPHSWIIRLGTWSVLAFQVAFPILIWFRKLRPSLLIAGTFFHLAIIFVIGLADFGIIMLVAYLAFSSEQSATRWLDRFNRIGSLGRPLFRQAKSRQQQE